ncbi:MAG: NADH-quinone oxidoreductase subunit G [Actinomycetota bacterium]
MTEQAVTFTIDGRQVSAPAGTLIIRAAEAIGVHVPRFCDHPLLDPVGACRQCLVEIEGQQKLATACTTPVADGMVVMTQQTSAAAKKGQEGQLEFLLINHPLDCPVCDRGGECPLQDQALAFGTGRSRYIDPKRVYEKPLTLSPLVLLDRERCVLCARCTRFCDQISGERFIELFDRGAAEQVAIAPGEDFRSPFSGNTVQICPVGALTSATYRFAARPFDVASGESVCSHCASGCTLRVDVRGGEVVRHLARDNPDVNEAWLCDKGRYGHRFVDRNRLEAPYLSAPGLTPGSFEEVFAQIVERASGGRVAFLVGGRLSDEDNFALSKLARTVFGTNDLDFRPPWAGETPVEVERRQAAGSSVTYADVERAAVILVVGLDTREELPILHLRIRKAVRQNGARVVVIHPRRTPIDDVAEHIVCRPGEEAAVLDKLHDDAGFADLATTLREAGDTAVVLAGPRLAASPAAVAAAAALAERTGARFALLSRRAGDRGALGAGAHPALLPGGRRVADDGERSEVEQVWGRVPPDPGMNTRRILEACARREMDVLFLVGVDPLVDFPEPRLARRALENARYRVVVDIDADALRAFADAMLPGAPAIEKEGSYSDWEGRSQAFTPVRPPTGLARPEWRIFQELSEVAGKDMGFRSIQDIRKEMSALITAGDLRGGSGGVLRPESEADARESEDPPRSDGGAGSDGLVLFTYPLLVDEGRLSAGADELKAALEEQPFVEVHPEDAIAAGVDEGVSVRLTTEAGEAVLPAHVTDRIAKGCVFIPWNQPGFRANALLSGSLHTAVTLVPAEAREEAPA